MIKLSYSKQFSISVWITRPIGQNMNSQNRQVNIETKYIVKMASHIIGNEDRTWNKQFVTTVFCCCSVTKLGPILCENCIAIFKKIK